MSLIVMVAPFISMIIDNKIEKTIYQCGVDEKFISIITESASLYSSFSVSLFTIFSKYTLLMLKVVNFCVDLTN